MAATSISFRQKTGHLFSIAFNDASFRTQNLDDYTAHRRNSVGNLQVSPGNIDFSGLSITDPTMDPLLNQVKGHLLAWSPTPTPGLLSDSGNSLTGLVSSPAASDSPINDWNFFVSGDVILGQNFRSPKPTHRLQYQRVPDRHGLPDQQKFPRRRALRLQPHRYDARPAGQLRHGR